MSRERGWLHERIIVLAAQGLDVGQIRQTIRAASPMLTPGQISGAINRVRKGGVVVPGNARSAQAKAANASRSPERRKEIASKASQAAVNKHNHGGADEVARARERSASAWPAAQKGDHRPAGCRPKTALGVADNPCPEPPPQRWPSRLACSWVDGERGRWVLCEERSLFGVPFCAEHSKVGLERRRRPNNDGAVDGEIARP